MLSMFCLMFVVSTMLAGSASSSIAESSTAVASETPQLSSSSGVPVLPSISQPSSTAQVAPSSSEAQQVPSSSSVFVTSVLPLLTQAATASSSAALVAPSPSNTRQHSSSSSAPTFSSSAVVPSPGNSSAAPKPTPLVSYKNCSSNKCKNEGTCIIGCCNVTLCICKDNYYGSICEKKANPAFEPVVYALAPVSGVLLIALCVAMVLLCKKNRVYDMESRKVASSNISLQGK